MYDAYHRILAECREATTQMADNALNASMGDVLSALNEAPCMSIADMNAAGESVLKTVDAYCGMTLPRELLTDLRDGAVCLALENGGQESLLRMTAEGVRVADPGHVFAGQDGEDTAELVFTQAATLGSDHFLLCSGLTHTYTWTKLLNHIDILCLHVNATAAMTYAEKGLLSMLSNRFTERPVAIWLDNQEHLNSDEERECVITSIRATLKRTGLQAPILNTAEETVQWLRERRNQPDLMQQKKKSLLRNLLLDMQARIDVLLKAADASSQGFDTAIRQLNGQRTYLELAGRVAASATLDNAFDQMKFEIHDGMRDYSEQMVSQICVKVEKATPDELERMETLIPAYQSRVWELYQNRLTDTLNDRYDAIFQSIMHRMEEDAGALFEQLDPDAIAALCRTMGLEDAFTSSSSFASADLNSIEKLKRETRNMMLLSIPVILVNVPLGLAALVGTKMFGSLGKRAAQEEYRKELITSVKSGASASLQQLFTHVDAKFDAAKQASAENIQHAYAQIIDLLIANIRTMGEEYDRLRKQAELYTHVKAVKIPEWRNLLTNA